MLRSEGFTFGIRFWNSQEELREQPGTDKMHNTADIAHTPLSLSLSLSTFPANVGKNNMKYCIYKTKQVYNWARFVLNYKKVKSYIKINSRAVWNRDVKKLAKKRGILHEKVKLAKYNCGQQESKTVKLLGLF